MLMVERHITLLQDKGRKHRQLDASRISSFQTSTLPNARQYMPDTHLEMVVANATAADAWVALNQDGARLGVPALHVEVALLEAQRLRAKTSIQCHTFSLRCS
jgi:hypothetical protein